MEALALARQLMPDLVLMDLSMPRLDGVGATERLRRGLPDVKVIALTAYPDRAHRTRMLQVGAVGYLIKRSAVDELIHAIRTVAAAGMYVDPVLGGSMLREAARPSQDQRASIINPLSDRVVVVLRRIAWVESDKEIAAKLGISTKTVET